jgi:F-type H+-transporting ATPase subunit delta
MTQAKQIKEFAKQLFRMSLENGELSPERVDGVLKALEKNPPRHYLATLKAYLKVVEREVAKSTAVISHAGQLTPDIISNIKRQMEGKYGRRLDTVERGDPDLIAGVRVVVDCDVYDASIQSALTTLESSLN